MVTDDLLYWNKPEQDVSKLLDYAVENGFTLRDDSPLVAWYVENNLDTWTVSHPHFFEAVYKTRPTVFELEHYSSVKKSGYWLGKNGEEIIPGIKVSGAEMFRNAMKLIHPTYIGFHGYLGEWLNENPDLTIELLNHCGYWYFPKSVNTIQYKNDELSFEMEWQNKGVAPACSVYRLKGKLIPEDTSSKSIEFEIENSGNKNWMPNRISTEKYKVSLPENLKGDYQLAIQLFDEKSGEPVEIGLATDTKAENYFVIQNLSF